MNEGNHLIDDSQHSLRTASSTDIGGTRTDRRLAAGKQLTYLAEELPGLRRGRWVALHDQQLRPRLDERREPVGYLRRRPADCQLTGPLGRHAVGRLHPRGRNAGE